MHFPLAHNGIVVAIIAHGLIGVSLIWDKVLLRRPETTNLPSFVFWLGLISVFGLVLIPFGFHWPEPGTVALAFGAGVLHLIANYFYYAALKAGEASQTLAIVGGFSPVATALIAIALLKHPLGQGSAPGFILLVLGGFVMFFSERLNLKLVLPTVLLASASFGLVNVMQKLAFDRTDFVSGYVLFTFGTFIGSLLLLLRSSWRKQIFETSEKAQLDQPARRDSSFIFVRSSPNSSLVANFLSTIGLAAILRSMSSMSSDFMPDLRFSIRLRLCRSISTELCSPLLSQKYAECSSFSIPHPSRYAMPTANCATANPSSAAWR